MRHNVTISGLMEQEKESPRAVVNDFLSNTMNLTFEPKDIWVAHHIGKQGPKPRLMVVRCAPELKSMILQNMKILKGVKNQNGDYFYVNKQQPDKLNERDRENRAKIKEIKNKEAHLATHLKTKTQICSGILYVNNVPNTKAVKPPL